MGNLLYSMIKAIIIINSNGKLYLLRIYDQSIIVYAQLGFIQYQPIHFNPLLQGKRKERTNVLQFHIATAHAKNRLLHHIQIVRVTLFLCSL